MPEKNINNAESDFHRRRRAFIILGGGVLVAPDGFDGAHFDLLRQSGFTSEEARDLIASNPRGYALDGNVFLYQGESFSCLSSENEKTARIWFPFFEKNGWLKTDGRIYNGMRAGEKGTVWRPIKEIEKSF